MVVGPGGCSCGQEIFCRSGSMKMMKSTMAFENFDAKNFIFSIFFKLSQMLSIDNDVKTVPVCFATLKATPKASEHILGSFEKIFFSSNFRPPEAVFAHGADQPFENGNL